MGEIIFNIPHLEVDEIDQQLYVPKCFMGLEYLPIFDSNLLVNADMQVNIPVP